MVVVSMLPHAEIGGNDHREDAPQFISNSMNWLSACSFPVSLNIFFYLFLYFLVKFTLMFEWKLEGYFSKRFSKIDQPTPAYKRSVKTLDINKNIFQRNRK